MVDNNIILRMKNITKKFPGVLALDNVSLSAYQGEIHALCGENGAGKSTLMKILSGSYEESSYKGEIYVNGEECHFLRPADSEAIGIGMIYQEISMHLDLSIAENLFLGRWPKKIGMIDWKKLKENAKYYLDMVGLEIDSTTELRQLSASQQQLVSIARALSKNPHILVLDEPTSPLTSKEADKLFEILHSLKEKGIACILITHKMDEVFTHADRVTVIRDGKSISSHPLKETSPREIIKDMVGREITNFYPKEDVPIGDVILEIKNFSVRHPLMPNRTIIDSVSLELRKGEILGLAGLVGAGRSELVNAIFGKDKKLGGEVFIDSKPIDIKNPFIAINNGIALVTEDRKVDGIIANMSIPQNISLPNLKAISRHGIMKLKKEGDFSEKYYKELMIKAPSINTLLQQLSGGNQQKVVLAKWMAQNPKVLILDEPTRGIDVATKYEIYKIMVKLAREGVGIIMISSELPELMSMSDRIMVISNKKIAGSLNHCEYSQEKIMELSAL